MTIICPQHFMTIICPQHFMTIICILFAPFLSCPTLVLTLALLEVGAPSGLVTSLDKKDSEAVQAMM